MLRPLLVVQLQELVVMEPPSWSPRSARESLAAAALRVGARRSSEAWQILAERLLRSEVLDCADHAATLGVVLIRETARTLGLAGLFRFY
jgi:hypothetical protein